MLLALIKRWWYLLTIGMWRGERAWTRYAGGKIWVIAVENPRGGTSRVFWHDRRITYAEQQDNGTGG